MKNHPPYPKREESHPLTGKTVEETGDDFITTSSQYNNNKNNIFDKIGKKYNEIQFTKKQNGLEQYKNKNRGKK